MRFCNWLKGVFPPYAWIPALSVVLLNSLIYSLTKPITRTWYHYDLSISIDDAIPFVPFFILFYVLAYVQWYWNWFYHARIGREEYYHLVMGDNIAKIICLIFFLAMPTAIYDRPAIDTLGNTPWDLLTKLAFWADEPTNLFPSIHCVASWMAVRGACMMKGMPRWYVPLHFVVAVLVFASTVLVKQHFFVDIFAGIAVAELGLFLSKRFSLWKVFARFEPKFAKKPAFCEQAG